MHAQFSAGGAVVDADLAAIVEAWPSLPADVRTEIVRAVAAAMPSD